MRARGSLCCTGDRNNGACVRNVVGRGARGEIDGCNPLQSAHGSREGRQSRQNLGLGSCCRPASPCGRWRGGGGTERVGSGLLYLLLEGPASMKPPRLVCIRARTCSRTSAFRCFST